VLSRRFAHSKSLYSPTTSALLDDELSIQELGLMEKAARKLPSRLNPPFTLRFSLSGAKTERDDF
jgi:hypothetical protein